LFTDPTDYWWKEKEFDKIEEFFDFFPLNKELLVSKLLKMCSLLQIEKRP